MSYDFSTSIFFFNIDKAGFLSLNISNSNIYIYKDLCKKLAIINNYEKLFN